MNAVKLVRAKVEDASMIQEVQDKAFLADFQKYGHCPSYQCPLEKIVYKIQNMIVYLVMLQDEVVGYMVLKELGQGEFHLSHLGIVPEHQGEGIGTKAVKQMIAAHPQAEYWTLDTPNDKSQNHHFYEKLGFVKVGEQDCSGMILNLYRKDVWMDGRFQIRPIAIQDYDDIFALWNETEGMGLRSLDDSREGIQKFINRNPWTSFVALLDGKIIGNILCGQDGRRGYVYHTAVKSSCRGKGFGKRLVQAALDALAKQGITKATLVVFTHNEIGNSFWKSQGWRQRVDLNYYQYLIDERNQ